MWPSIESKTSQISTSEDQDTLKYGFLLLDICYQLLEKKSNKWNYLLFQITILKSSVLFYFFFETTEFRSSKADFKV